jgi:hypothetical protein
MASISGNFDFLPGTAGQELLNINYITTTNLSSSSTASLAATNVSGLLTSTSTVDSTSSTSQSAINTTGGLSVVKSAFIGGNMSATNGTFSGSTSITGSLNANGGTTTPTMTLPQATLTSATSSTPIVQGGSNIPLNALRIRTADTTNTAARVSIANTAMANSYYDSGLTMYNLGSSETSTNYERLSFGINSGGGYLNYLYGGSGVARTFNLYNGSVFTSGGALQLANTLGVSGTSTLAGLNATNGSFSGTLGVSGSSNLSGLNATNGSFSGTLGVSGSSTLAALNATNASLSGTLGVTGLSTLAGLNATNGSFSGTFGVSGSSTLAALNATNASLSGTLGVTGLSTLAGLNATNGSFSGTLGVTGLSTLAGLNATNGSFSGTLGVTGLLTNTSSIDTTSSTSASAINTTGGLSVAKAANIGTTLGVTGTSTLAALNATNASLSGTLGVTGTSTLAALNATNASLSGTLGVTGVISSTSTTDTTSSTSASAINTTGGLSVAKAANIGTTLGVTGTSNLAAINGTTLTTTGTNTFSGLLDCNNQTDATSLTSASSISTAGGISIALTAWMKNSVVTTPYYSMWYTNSTQTITKTTITPMAVGWTSWAQSDTKMSAAFSGTSGTTNVYTMPYTGLYSLQANIRMTPTIATAGISEAWFNCTNSTIYGTTAVRLGHCGVYSALANVAVVPAAHFTGYFNVGDQVNINVYNAQVNVTLTSGNDVTFGVVLLQRSA